MSKAKDKSKSKEKRLEEKERVDAETQRSLAVAEMKKAHRLIEETEKTRIRPILRSVCSRIETHMKTLVFSADMFGKYPFEKNKILSDFVLDYVKVRYKIYESIRYDFQKSMTIKDEEMNILFPKIELKMADGSDVFNCFSHITMQLGDMGIYCLRMLT